MFSKRTIRKTRQRLFTQLCTGYISVSWFGDSVIRELLSIAFTTNGKREIQVGKMRNEQQLATGNWQLATLRLLAFYAHPFFTPLLHFFYHRFTVMSAILTALFKFTFGLAAARARNVLADRLKEGDVVDQKFRDLIVSDIKDIKSRLEALSRNDLMAAVEHFDTGLCYLFDAVSYVRNNDNAIRRAAQVSEKNKEKHFDELTLTSATSPENTIVLTVGIQNLQLNESVDEEAAKTAFSDAKDRFSEARKKATDASTNVALSTFDRITAIRYRVMAAMLEYAADAVGTSSDWKSALKRALPECKKCLEKLNSLPAVKNCFKVELGKRIGKGLIGNDERKKIISIVCQVNSVIYDAIQAVGGDLHVWVWPYVDTGNDRVDPLRDGRISKVLRKDNMEHCCVTPSPWSSGQESYVGDTTVKVFDLF